MFLKLYHFWILDNLYYLVLKTAAPMPLRFIFHEVQVPCVHIDQLFIFCPYWAIFLFLFSLEHQIGKRALSILTKFPSFSFAIKWKTCAPGALGTSHKWLPVHCCTAVHLCSTMHLFYTEYVVFQWCCYYFCYSGSTVGCCSFTVLQCNSVPGDLQHDYTKVQLFFFKSALFLFFLLC